MNYTRYLLAIGLLAFAVEARADWIGSDISDIINNVKTILAEVMGDVKDTAADLKRQLTLLQQQGDTMKETAEDILAFLQHRRQPFLDFVNGNPSLNTGRCGPNTPCANFRTDLDDFVLDIADLKSRFPQIEQHGLGDGTILVDVIDHLPPHALFGLYETFQRIPNWQDIPQNLADFYDEVGDPDAFSAEPLGTSPATTATAASVTVKAGNSGGQANFGSPEEGIRKFCSLGKEVQVTGGGVRYNRVKMAFTWVSNMLDGTSEFLDAFIVLEVLGEGSSVPLFIKGGMKTVGKVIESIFVSLDTYRANLDICKQIETDVAQGAMLVNYRTPGGVKTVYWVVKGVMARKSMQGIDQTQANSLLDQAGRIYSQPNPDYVSVYANISAAYQALFCSGTTGKHKPLSC